MFQRHDTVGAHCFNCVIRHLLRNYAPHQQHGTSCIFLTAQLDRAMTAQDVALGVIVKPYNPPELLHAVKVVAAIRKGETLSTSTGQLELFG